MVTPHVRIFFDRIRYKGDKIKLTTTTLCPNVLFADLFEGVERLLSVFPIVAGEVEIDPRLEDVVVDVPCVDKERVVAGRHISVLCPKQDLLHHGVLRVTVDDH